MKEAKSRSIKMFLGISIIVSTLFLSILTTNAQYPFSSIFYPTSSYYNPMSYMPFGYSSPYSYSSLYNYSSPYSYSSPYGYSSPFGYSSPYGYSPSLFNPYNSYSPYNLSMMMNPFSMSLLSMGLSSPIMSPLAYGRMGLQVTSALPLPTSALAPVLPVTTVVAAPILPVTTLVAAPVLPSASIVVPTSTNTALSVLIASLLINTGNPQVRTVLLLILSDPTLLSNPLLLNSLINTGNPEVALVLALLSAGLI